MPTLSLDEIRSLVTNVLVAHGTSTENAALAADALAMAEADGQKGHGLGRLTNYAAQARSGMVDGQASPEMTETGSAGVRIDVRSGFAYAAFKLAQKTLIQKTPETGIAAAVIANSHHTGVVGHLVEPLADAGLIGLYFGNGPDAIAPWGGNRGLFGTNPIGFACPRRSAQPLVIDLSLSKVARGTISVAQQNGEKIPEGWALDEGGNPTTDADAAMAGTMLPLGDAKGAQLVLMVEILAAALSASNFGFEANSFYASDGDPPHTGQCLIAIDPENFSSGAFLDRMETLIDAILDQPGTRLPGARRYQLRAKAERDGVEISASLFAELKALDGASLTER